MIFLENNWEDGYMGIILIVDFTNESFKTD